MDFDLERFTALLDDAVATAQASGWPDRLERVLTDGYSEVLALENARRRAIRELGTAPGSPAAEAASERIAELSREIRELRDLLEAATSAVFAA